MALDPITGLPEKPKRNSLLELKGNIKTPSVYDTAPIAGEMDTDYDNGLSRSTLPFRDYLRADNQSNLQAIGNTFMRMSNMVPEFISGFMSLEDAFPGVQERGNAVMDAMDVWKKATEEAFPIHSNPDNFINMNDISGLINSAGSFVAAGLVSGGVLNYLGAISKLNKIGVLGEALKIGANATILNRMEAHVESTPVYKKAYEDAINKGIEPIEAKKIADAAADEVEFVNWANLPLNLTSAAMLIKGANRPFKELVKDVTAKNTFKNLGIEGVQESGEEFINYTAQRAGERTADNMINNKDQDVYQFANDFFTRENAKSMVLGFLGGFAQTGISTAIGNLDTKWYTGKYVEQKKQYKDQQDFLNTLSAQKETDINKFLGDIKEYAETDKRINALRAKGDEVQAQALEEQLFADRAFRAFEINAEQGLANFLQERIDTGTLTETEKARAEKAVTDLQTYRKFYDQINPKHPNKELLYTYKVFSKQLGEEISNLENTIKEKNSEIETSISEMADLSAKANKTDAITEVERLRDLAKQFEQEAGIPELQTELESVYKRASEINEEFTKVLFKPIVDSLSKQEEIDKVATQSVREGTASPKQVKDNPIVSEKAKAQADAEGQKAAPNKKAKNPNIKKLFKEFKNPEQRDKVLAETLNERYSQVPAALETDLDNINKELTSKKFREELEERRADSIANDPDDSKVDYIDNLLSRIDNIKDNPISSVEELIDIIQFSDFRQVIDNYFNESSITDEARESINRQSSSDETGVIDNTPEEYTKDNRDPGRIILWESELQTSDGRKGQEKVSMYEEKFQKGLDLLNDPNVEIPENSDVYFEYDPNHYPKGNDSDENFAVLVYIYHNQEKVYIGKLSANSALAGTALTQIRQSFGTAEERLAINQPTPSPIKALFDRKTNGWVRNNPEPRERLSERLNLGESIILGIVKKVTSTGELYVSIPNHVALETEASIPLPGNTKATEGSAYFIIKNNAGKMIPVKPYIERLQNIPSLVENFNNLIEKLKNTKDGNEVQSLLKKILEITSLQHIAYKPDTGEMLIAHVKNEQGYFQTLWKQDGNRYVPDFYTVSIDEFAALALEAGVQIAQDKINRDGHNEKLDELGVLLTDLDKNHFHSSGSRIKTVFPTPQIKQPVAKADNPFGGVVSDGTSDETSVGVGGDVKLTGEQVKNKLQEIEKQPVKINITQDANGKMEQTSQEVIDNIKAELDKTGLPYSDVVSNDKGSTYFVITKDGQQHEILRVLQSGGKLVPTNLTKAKWINHLIKTEKDAVVKAVEQSLKETPQAGSADVGGAKADIERRRQEELDKIENPSRLANQIKIEYINNKYDAELDALEGKPTVSQPAVEPPKRGTGIRRVGGAKGYENRNDTKAFTNVDNKKLSNKDIAAEIAKIKKILPSILIGDVEQIMRSDLWGAFKDGIIYLNSGAPSGVIYHEAFHAVFNIMLTNEKKKALLDKAKEKYRKYTQDDLDLIKATTGVENQEDLIDLYYEEQLADDYMEYSLDRDAKPLSLIERFFEKIRLWFKNFFGKDLSIIDTFSAIENGNYSKPKFTRTFTGIRNMLKYKGNLAKDASMVIEAKGLLFTIYDDILEQIKEGYKVQGFSFVDDTDIIKQIGVKKLVGYLFTKLYLDTLTLYDKQTETGNKTDILLYDRYQNLLENLVVNYDDVLDAYERGEINKEVTFQVNDLIFAPNLFLDKNDDLAIESLISPTADMMGPLFHDFFKQLRDLGVNIDLQKTKAKTEEESLIEEEEEDDNEEATVEEKVLENWQFKLNTQSSKKSASAYLKRLLSTIPKKDNRGRQVFSSYQYSNNPQEYKNYEDYNEVWSYLEMELTNIFTPQDMIAKIKSLIPEKKFMQDVYNKVMNDHKFKTDLFINLAAKTSTKSILLRSSIETGTDRENEEYEYVKTRLIQANKLRAFEMVVENLRSDFQRNVWNKYKSLKNTTSQKTKANEILKDFTAIKDLLERKPIGKNFAEVLNDAGNGTIVYLTDEGVSYIHKTLKKHSINLSTDVIRRLSEHKTYKNKYTDLDLLFIGNSNFMSFAKALVNGINIFDTIDNDNNETSTLENIARKVAKASPQLSSNSSRNIENNQVYNHTPAGFVHQLVHNIKHNNLLKNYVKFKQFKNSPLVNDLINDSTFLNDHFDVYNFDGMETVDDIEKTYTKLTPKEITIAQLSLFSFMKNKKMGYYRAPIASNSPSQILYRYKKVNDIDQNINQKNIILEQHYLALLQDRDAMEALGSKKYNYYTFMNLPENADLKDKEAIKEKIDQFLTQKTENFMKYLKDLGILNDTGRFVQGTFDTTLYEGSNPYYFLTDFYWNNFLFQNQISELTSGNPSNYKNLEDYQKRNKQIQSPSKKGDTSATYTFNGKEYKVNKNYLSISLADILEDSDPEFISFLEKVFGENSEDIKNKFKGNNITDAFGLVSPNRRRELDIMFNRWSDKKQKFLDRHLLNNDLENNSEYSSLLKVNKPFAFQHAVIKGNLRPVQVKNSEAVLTPKNIVELGGNTKEQNYLNKLYDIITKIENQFGLTVSVNFESAYKAYKPYAFKSLDELEKYANSLKTTDFNELTKDDKILVLDNEFYGDQQEVPEHFLDAENNFGVQIKRLIMADIPLDTVYDLKQPVFKNLRYYFAGQNTITHQELITLYHSAVANIVKSSEESLNNELNTTENIINKLRETHEMRSNSIQFIEALQMQDNKPYLPVWFPFVSRKNENVLLSFFKNKIINTKMPGPSAVNKSSVGYSDKLKYKVNEETGQLEYIEVILPKWSKKHFNKFDTLSSEDPSIMELLAYRIPTEGKYSMFKIKVVGFSDVSDGGGIIMPREVTTQAGLDFDIDKLYIMAYNLDKDGRRITDGFKGEQNKILDVAKAVLSHEESAKHILNPGGFDDFKKHAFEIALVKKGYKFADLSKYSLKELEKLLKENADDNWADVETQNKFFANNMAGNDLIGFFANHNTAHAIFQHTGFRIATEKQTADKDGTTKVIPLHNHLLYEGKIMNSLSAILDINGDYISRNLATYLSAVVDNAKDPLANYVNMNLLTVDTFASLIRLGFPKRYVEAFMAQPIIEKYVSDYNKLGGDKTAELQLEKDIAKILEEKEIKLTSDISFDELQKGLENNVTDSELQLKVMFNFLHIKNEIAAELAQWTSNIKTDNSSKFSTIAELEDLSDKIVNLVTKENSIFIYDVNPFLNPLVDSYYQSGILYAINKVSTMLPWFNSKLKVIKEKFNNRKKKGLGRSLTIEERQSLHDQFINYVSFGYHYYLHESNNDLFISLPETFDKIRAVVDFSETPYEKLLTRFTVSKRKVPGVKSIKGNKVSEISRLELNRIGMENSEKDDALRLLEMMLKDDSLAIPATEESSAVTWKQFAENLIKYSFMSSGFNITPFSINEIIPPSFIHDLDDGSFLTYLEDVLFNDENALFDNFEDQFLRQSFTESHNFLPTYNVGEKGIGTIKSSNKVLKVKEKDFEKIGAYYNQSDLEKSQSTIPEYFYVRKGAKKVLYRVIGNTFFVDDSEKLTLYYEPVSKLGIKNYLIEYNPFEDFASIVDSNNLDKIEFETTDKPITENNMPKRESKYAKDYAEWGEKTYEAMEESRRPNIDQTKNRQYSMSKIEEIKKNKDFILPANAQGKTLEELKELLKTIAPGQRDLVIEDIKNITTGDYKYYINTKTGVKLQRVSNFIKEIDKDEKGPLLKSASAIGRALDKLARDVFSGKDVDPTLYAVIDPSDLKLLEDFKKYIDELKEVKRRIEANGETIYADDILVYNDEIGVAGTVDIFTIDEKGIVRIYDMKTMRAKQYMNRSEEIQYRSKLTSRGNGIEPDYYSKAVFKQDEKGNFSVVPNKTQDSLFEKHQKQLSTYAILANNTHNLEVSHIFVIPTDVYYEEGEFKTSYIKLQGLISHKILPEFKGARMKSVVMEIPEKTSEISESSENKELFDSNLPKINIYAGTGENAELSNFAIRPFKINYGASFTEFDSVEQAFQATKKEYSEDNSFNSNLEEKILESKNGGQIKKLGSQFKNFDSKEWDSDSSKIMKNFILESFKQNPDALTKLLATGNAELTHIQDKGKWGKEFPKLLMEVRQELKSTQNQSEDPIELPIPSQEKIDEQKNECKTGVKKNPFGGDEGFDPNE